MNQAQLQKMMKQAQKMQDEMQKAQQDLENKEYNISTGGGAINLVMTGDKKIVSLSINEDVIEKDEKDMLEQMIVSAVNTLSTTIDQEMETTMSGFTQGLPF